MFNLRLKRLLAIIVPVLLLGSWLALTALLWRSGPNVQEYLRLTFGHRSRFGTVSGLNNIAGEFWVLHTLLCSIAVVLVFRRRFDALTVLLIGPSLSAILLAFEEDWTDPAWFTIIAVLCIGYLVGIPFTLAWLFVKWWVRRVPFGSDGIHPKEPPS